MNKIVKFVVLPLAVIVIVTVAIGAYIAKEIREARDISSGPCQTRDKAAAYRVDYASHDNGYRRSCLLRRADGGRPSSHDDVHIKLYQFRCQARKSFVP